VAQADTGISSIDELKLTWKFDACGIASSHDHNENHNDCMTEVDCSSSSSLLTSTVISRHFTSSPSRTSRVDLHSSPVRYLSRALASHPALRPMRIRIPPAPNCSAIRATPPTLES
jgi:hypothetical protein